MDGEGSDSGLSDVIFARPLEIEQFNRVLTTFNLHDLGTERCLIEIAIEHVCFKRRA